MKTVLLITGRSDPTADLLVAELRRRDLPCLRWNMDQYPLGSVLTYRASEAGFASSIVSDGRRLDLVEIGSVWWRGFRPSGLPDELGDQDRRFAEWEARLALTALMTVGDFLWINHPERERLADSKPGQLFTARRVGLDIPRTIITNDPDEVRAFLAETQGRTVYKGLSQPLNLEPGKSLFTGVLTDKEIARLDLIRHSPGIFQELVPKSYELRVTVV